MTSPLEMYIFLLKQRQASTLPDQTSNLGICIFEELNAWESCTHRTTKLVSFLFQGKGRWDEIDKFIFVLSYQHVSKTTSKTAYFCTLLEFRAELRKGLMIPIRERFFYVIHRKRLLEYLMNKPPQRGLQKPQNFFIFTITQKHSTYPLRL